MEFYSVIREKVPIHMSALMKEALHKKGTYFRNPFKWISRTGRTNRHEKKSEYLLFQGWGEELRTVKGHGNLPEVRIMLSNHTVIWVTQESILVKTHLKCTYDMCISSGIQLIIIKRKEKRTLRDHWTLANETHAEMFHNEVYQFLQLTSKSIKNKMN